MQTTPKFMVVVAVLTSLALAGCDSGNQEKVGLPSNGAKAEAKKADAPEDQQDSAKDDAEAQAQPERMAQPAGEESPSTLGVERSAAGRRLSGSFETRRSTNVAASVGGIIDKVYVEEGDVVDKGDRLIIIDGQDYQLRVEQARAALAAAQAQVDTLDTQYQRTLKLQKNQAVADSQVDQLSGQLAGARAQLQQAKVGLRMAKKARGDALIRAPYAGVITDVSVAEGDFAAPGPQPLMRLEEVQKLYLRVHVPEEYSGSVTQGDELRVEIPALDKQMKVQIDRVNPTISKRSRAFDVLAEIDNTSLAIRPGMFAQITLVDQPQSQPQSNASAEKGDK